MTLSGGLYATPAEAQQIQAQPASLATTVVKGQTASLELNLRNTGTGQRHWEVVSWDYWLTVAPPLSGTITSEIDKVRLTVNSASLATGIKSTVLYVWDNEKLLSIPVTVTVTASGGTTTASTGSTSSSSSSTPSTSTGSTGGTTSSSPTSSTGSTTGGTTSSTSSSTATPTSSTGTSSAGWTATQPLQLQPTSVALSILKGQMASVEMSLRNAGTGQHSWEVVSWDPWLTVTPPISGTITTEVDKVRLTVSTASLTVGTRSTQLYVWAGEKLLSLPVTVTVTASGGTTTASTGSTSSSSSSTPSTSTGSTGGTTSSSPSPIGSAAGGTTTGSTTSTAASATVTWNANSEADLAGYRVYIGTGSGSYGAPVDVGKVTSYVASLQKGQTYFFAVSAYDTSGNESQKSAEISRSIY